MLTYAFILDIFACYVAVPRACYLLHFFSTTCVRSLLRYFCYVQMRFLSIVVRRVLLQFEAGVQEAFLITSHLT
jgi:hypothetical protein